jgi:hypothetical protein
MNSASVNNRGSELWSFATRLGTSQATVHERKARETGMRHDGGEGKNRFGKRHAQRSVSFSAASSHSA